MSKTVDRKRIREWFQNHEVTERQSISWHMAARYRTVRMHKQGAETLATVHTRASSTYAYSVTWTPGTLVVAGDLGEFTVTHYHAMDTIKNTLGWLDGISFQYLMEKSTAKEVYDAEGTLADIVRMANEPAVEMLDGYRPLHGIGQRTQGYRHDLQQYRRELREGREEWIAECLPLLGPWKGDRKGGEALPALEDYLPEQPEPLKVAEKRRYSRSDSGDVNKRFHIPEGWELWLALWDEVLDYEDPNVIFTASGRRRIKEELEERLESEHEAAEFCGRIGLDDYYGARSYPHQCYVWAEAIQAWVDKVKPRYWPQEESAA